MKFEDILIMIKRACNNAFYTGTKGREETVIECATQIYIAQMTTNKGGDRNEV